MPTTQGFFAKMGNIHVTQELFGARGAIAHHRLLEGLSLGRARPLMSNIYIHITTYTYRHQAGHFSSKTGREAQGAQSKNRSTNETMEEPDR